jgi:ABC-2 type transport system permease protein
VISVLLRPPVVSALVRRDYVGTRSYRLAFLLDIFYGVLDIGLYYFISRTFSDFSPAQLGGAPTYFAFAAVGVILGAVLDATSSGVAHRLREEQVTGTLEALSAEPVTPFELCVGLVGFPFSFAVARAGFYLLIAAALFDLDLSKTSWTGLTLILIASGAALAPIGMLAGAAVLVFKRGTLVSTTLMYLLTILAGMVFPVSALPNWLEPLANIVPLTYAFNGARDAIFSGSGWGTDALVLLAWAAALWPLALSLFAGALGYAKRVGSLAQY